MKLFRGRLLLLALAFGFASVQVTALILGSQYALAASHDKTGTP